MNTTSNLIKQFCFGTVRRLLPPFGRVGVGFLVCLLPLLRGAGVCSAQNIGINSTGAAPNTSALLDVDATGMNPQKGILIPRVSLTSTTDGVTIATPANSLLVYNSGTGGLSPAGYYYNQGTTAAPNWVSFLTNNVNTPAAWSLNGNTGTTASTSAIGSAVNNNFIGTTDAKDFVFASNNLERLRITSAGNVGIGTTSPTGPLEVIALTTVIEATGGTITHSGGYTIHTFTSSGTFTMNTASTSVEYLVVGGGGSGGSSSAAWGHCGGGGGAGRFREGTLAVTAQAYSVTIGNGGSNGSDGGNSIFSTITSEGGGSGADAGGDGIGANGGSGGGGTLGTSGAGGSSVGAFGNNGGAKGTTVGGGGGGGSSAVGEAGWGVSTGAGGNGIVSSISGSPVTYAGGGGGGYGQPNNNGGTGGGGRGGIISNDAGMAGTANSGGGGGGAYVPGSGTLSGAAGGSGIVIIRYLTPANNVLGSAFLVGSTGNVGVGTTGANSKLQIAGGDVNIESIGSGVIIRSPDGTCYRVTVANGGSLVTTAITCP